MFLNPVARPVMAPVATPPAMATGTMGMPTGSPIAPAVAAPSAPVPGAFGSLGAITGRTGGAPHFMLPQQGRL